MAYLKFISDKDLCTAVRRVINVIENAEQNADIDFHKNVVDPFSALFHGVTHSISYKEWIKQEKVRQTQKTMQNAIGDFHQDIIGFVPGWKNLGVGGGLDVINVKMKKIAEIKNKHNTTTGVLRVALYDAIKAKLQMPEYKKYTGYYVEIIFKGKKYYDKPFTPSDSKISKRRATRHNIRVIDGVSFYEMATGRKNALYELFEVLPQVIAAEHRYKLSAVDAQGYYELFDKAFWAE